MVYTRSRNRNRHRNLSKVRIGTVTCQKSELEPLKIVTVPQHCRNPDLGRPNNPKMLEDHVCKALVGNIKIWGVDECHDLIHIYLAGL